MITAMQQQLRTGLFLLLTLSTAVLSAACSEADDTDDSSGTGGDSAGTGGDSAVDPQFPTNTSEASVAAFLEAESYKSWAGDAEIRVGGSVNVHGDNLRVYLNDAAVDSHTDTVGENSDASPGSMAVKELYDESGTLVGRATSLLDESGEWTYYCDSSVDTLCTGSSIDMPVYNNFACQSCHGDQIYAPVPE